MQGSYHANGEPGRNHKRQREPSNLRNLNRQLTPLVWRPQSTAERGEGEEYDVASDFKQLLQNCLTDINRG